MGRSTLTALCKETPIQPISPATPLNTYTFFVHRGREKYKTEPPYTLVFFFRPDVAPRINDIVQVCRFEGLCSRTETVINKKTREAYPTRSETRCPANNEVVIILDIPRQVKLARDSPVLFHQK